MAFDSTLRTETPHMLTVTDPTCQPPVCNWADALTWKKSVTASIICFDFGSLEVQWMTV